MVAPHSPPGDDDSFVSIHRIPLAVALGVIVQTIFVAIWLTNLRADVNQLTRGHAMMETHIQTIDQNGTRATEVLRQRQVDVIAANAAQDARLRELENKLAELQRQSSENRIWIDQLTAAIRTFAHPMIAPQPSSPVPPQFRLQGVDKP